RLLGSKPSGTVTLPQTRLEELANGLPSCTEEIRVSSNSENELVKLVLALNDARSIVMMKIHLPFMDD
ncbi:MAG: hypothetical protein ACPHUO_05245, partial [Candidatus Poseidoniaceae archaeon]